MKVSELIKILQRADPELPVSIWDCYRDDHTLEVNVTYRDFYLSPEDDMPTVFISEPSAVIAGAREV